MSLVVNVVSAANLPNIETFGKSDPFCIVEFLGIRKETKVIDDELSPVWNEKLEFELKGQPLSPRDKILVQVKDKETIGPNKLLGQTDVPLKDLLKGSNVMEVNVNLMDANGRPNTATANLQITYNAPSSTSTKGQEGGVTVDQDYGDEDEEEEDVDEDVVGPDGKPSKKKKKKKIRRKLRKALSQKPQDFQIRVKVIEARQLQGANISPVTRIQCFNQGKQTRVKKSSNSPYWNEVFFFNFFSSPAELFDELLSFQVFNSRKLRSDSLIGGFKCDIGMVYDEPQHSLLFKWLLLSDPDDTMAGAKGYLKVCVTVMGPGDEAPSTTVQDKDDDEDIEANLLRPAGVQLRPATFILRVYKAEDLPRMDSDMMQGMKKMIGLGDEKKELVDPYVIFSFAGKEVRTKIMHCNDHPEFNQELRLGLRFPSMCERIKLQIKDWDRVTADDTMCGAYLSLTQCSAQGDSGFLPCFGPCFINFYGSPREYSDLPDEFDDLNLGKGEGVAYRGRCLVELQTLLGEMPEIDVEDMNNDCILRAGKFMRRRKYRLHCAFLNSSMISAIDAPVEFEVSIGNYGNKLDESVPPCSSTTQPTNAVFDGSFYYFLPWGNQKPCTVVDSHWEDISFRLEALNMINRIIERLESNVMKVKLGMKANLPTPEQAQLLISALDQLVVDCTKKLPEVTPGGSIMNDLDRMLRTLRDNELTFIRKEATKLRESATDVGEALQEMEGYLQQLSNIAIEPQNSMPDVVIWMICSGNRIAYYRMPAYEVLYSNNSDFCGRYCGQEQTIFLKYPQVRMDKDVKDDIPAMLRLKIWFGQEKEEQTWHKMQKEGELAVFAETYENQVNILGSWTNKGPTMSRPKWSDCSGKQDLNKEDFLPPAHWQWEGDWYVSPELSLMYDKDAGHRTYIEDVYECQGRIPGGEWGLAHIGWTDVKGDVLQSRDELRIPAGWSWDNDWQIDFNRPCDEEGWEYTVEATLGGYMPVQKTYHMSRRRRWVRSRTLIKDVVEEQEEERLAAEAAEGWEYAPLFNMKFHAKERKMDLVRRRRWHRRMKAEKPGASCFFQQEDKDKALAAPRMFLSFEKPMKYQLRAYIYQARDLLAGDQTGLSDPFARICFANQSMCTEMIEKTLCPTWDQTMLFEQVEIYGDPETIANNPPTIVIEIFDHDTFGEDEFLGRTVAKPMVKLDPSDGRTPVLQWFEVKKGSKYGGELLSAFELFLMNGKDLPFHPPKRGNLFLVPNGIRPVMQRTAIEVLCWGVRNMKKFQLANVTSPSVEFEVGGHVLNSKIIKNTKRNPNCDEPLLFFDVLLPKEELYMPPMNIKVRDHRQFGRKPLVGLHTLKTMEQFRFSPIPDDVEEVDSSGTPLPPAEHVVDMPDGDGSTGKKEYSLLEDDTDWWSKYYASIGELAKCKKYLNQGYDKLEVYKCELEKTPDYDDFTDFCNTFELKRGKQLEEEESNVVGEFKGSFRVYPLPGDPNLPMPKKHLTNLPDSAPIECLVRLYVVLAIDLQPNDPSGLADPYVTIQLGKKKDNNRDDYIPNSLNPVFGRLFEIKTTLPLHKDLVIQIKDYDLLSTDDVIGETVIDLENRYLTKFRATCGVPKTYCVSGPNQWRDSKKPKEILEDYCLRHHLPEPTYNGNNSVRVGGKLYNLADFEQTKPNHQHLGGPEQRLALHVLNTLPIVKEHVETRPLYNPLQPGIEQGKLQMWVDLFPLELGPPESPCDISPRKPKKYELRIIVWNTTDVILEEESITGEKMSDIYVKGWMAGIDDVQETDVHYRSLDGDGNFNWRFILPFEYIPAEECMVVKKKEHFWSLDETEQHLPANLVMQIWDNDKFSADDFLGTVDLNLNHMPNGAKKSGQCSLSQLPEVGKGSHVKMMSLFDSRRVRGFWPCYNDETGEKVLTGKIEMELELITEDEAKEKPAGKGREEPNMNPTLEPPKRPETSFLWFTSPFKTLKYIIWKNYKWYFIGGLLLILLILLVVLFIYSIPGATVNKIMGV